MEVTTSLKGTELDEVDWKRNSLRVFAVPLMRLNEGAGGEEGRMIEYSKTNPESGGDDDCDQRL